MSYLRVLHKKRGFLRFLLSILFLGICLQGGLSIIEVESAAVTLYASTDGDDSKDCSSIANRCETIQRAVDLSSGGETIKVSSGTYTDVDTTSAGYVVIITNDVTLIGGYDASFSEPPDPSTHTTTIDAESNGGVIFVDGTPAEIKGFTITGGDNTTTGGGGIRVYESTGVTITDNRIVNNNTDDDGGGIFVSGGSVTIKDNFIDGNTGTWSAGLRIINNAYAQVENNIISNNDAQNSAGGVDIECCKTNPSDIMVTLSGNQILDNNGASEGGGVRVSGTTAELVNNVIAQNLAVNGSGVAIVGTVSFPGLVNLAHNTFYGVISEGSGIWAGTYATVQLSNTVLANHSTGLVNSSPSDSTITTDYTVYYGNTANYGTDVTSTNEVSGDPGFVDVPSDDFHIQASSAARDAGTTTNVVTDPVTIDFDGDPRDSKPDLGADEYEDNLLSLLLFRAPASITKGSSASGPNQWFARVTLGDHIGDPGVAFHYVVWLHVPQDWTLPWATQYSFTGDFANGTLSPDWTAQSWVQDTTNCAFGGTADAGFKWRAFRGPQEALPPLVDRLDNQVNLRGGLGVPGGETSDLYGGVRVIMGTYYDSDTNGTADQYSCDHVAVTGITVP